MFTFLKRKFPRPFANAHWSLLVVLTLGWELLLLKPCREGPYYIETMLATLTVSLAAWVASLRVQGLNGWRKALFTVLGALYDLFLLLIVFILVALPIAVIQPAYTCYNDRFKIMALVLATTQRQVEIQDKYAANGSLKDIGVGLAVPI